MVATCSHEWVRARPVALLMSPPLYPVKCLLCGEHQNVRAEDSRYRDWTKADEEREYAAAGYVRGPQGWQKANDDE